MKTILAILVLSFSLNVKANGPKVLDNQNASAAFDILGDLNLIEIYPAAEYGSITNLFCEVDLKQANKNLENGKEAYENDGVLCKGTAKDQKITITGPNAQELFGILHEVGSPLTSSISILIEASELSCNRDTLTDSMYPLICQVAF